MTKCCYTFEVELWAEAETPEEAWEKALALFMQNPYYDPEELVDVQEINDATSN